MPTQQQVNSKPRRVVIDPHLRQPASIPPRAGAGAGARPAGARAVKDIRQTKEYKLAARRWISIMVGLPILMYTSWSLYERTYGDKRPKRLVETSTTTTSSSSSTSALASGKGEGDEEK
ncbi:hypothetical protein ASPBRDRAFT_127846 [Aspergillus brasiliensis CBS 101740]|uniref:Uncharacterized protein n=1 Tax=Aspergillus brasiliensis (strain CBS 101740 / IMI 381727 / IBT 21946) TaxID=767769 RepID=A0A1L9UHP4_ASPBC|nr:hypothetical protein ASPBRDRAFT_127846 [Aspergillus brasiliensis CBS 101740]